MKKVYLSFCSVVMLAALNAQTTYNAAGSKTVSNHKMPLGKKTTSASSVVRNKATFFTDDFSTSANWTMGNDAGNSDNWVVGTTIPNGSFPLDAITSTTAVNGFALFDSDMLCSGDQSAWLQFANPIDCSAHPAVAIEFEEHFRMWQCQTFVQVSTDGTNWTDFELNAEIATNDATVNPTVKAINISSVAGGQSTVYIRFYYLSGPGNGFDGCGYAWMVDDVSLRDLDDFDLRMVSAYWGTEGSWGARLPYTMVPTSQLAPVKFSGLVENAGAQTQADAVFGATATGYVATSLPTMLTAGQIDTLDATPDLNLSTTIGATAVSFAVSSLATDANPADNMGSQSISVTTTTYGRDMDNATSGSYNSGEGFEVGNIFDMFADDVALSGTVFIAATADPAAQVYIRLYNIDASGNFAFVEESASHQLTAAELGTFITLDLLNATDIYADSSYLLVAGSVGNGGASDDLIVGTSGASEPQTSFYYNYTDQTWYYVTSTPMVRLNVEGILGVNENASVSSFNVYPNPATDKVTVEYTLKNDSNVEVTVTDLTGKVVYTSKSANVASGNHAVSINTNNMSNGVYVVNVATNNTVNTQKLVLRK